MPVTVSLATMGDRVLIQGMETSYVPVQLVMVEHHVTRPLVSFQISPWKPEVEIPMLRNCSLSNNRITTSCIPPSQILNWNDCFWLSIECENLGPCENVMNRCEASHKFTFEFLHFFISILEISISAVNPGINSCLSSPCLNGGQCYSQFDSSSSSVSYINQYTCVCSTGFTGVNCMANTGIWSLIMHWVGVDDSDSLILIELHCWKLLLAYDFPFGTRQRSLNRESVRGVRVRF